MAAEIVTTATWPTAAKLARITGCIDEAVQEVEDLDLRAYAELDDTPPKDQPPPPTLAELGSLSSFIAVVASDLASLQSYLESIRQAHNEAALYVSYRGRSVVAEKGDESHAS
jgi:hypothetical protein